MALTREEKAKIAKRRYMRKWQRENRDRRRQYNEKYWARKYDELYVEEEEKAAE